MNIHELNSYNLGDAVKFHRRLNPRIWGRDEQLLPEVRERILTIAEDFQEFLGVKDLDIQDITISGSNAAYSYTKNSDIDLHIVVTMPDDPVYQELFAAKKYQYNDEHNIRIGGADVELYVQPADQPHISQGIYSVKDNSWISVPQRKRARIDDACVRDKVADLDARIHDAVRSGDESKIATLAAKIKAMRQAGLEQQGEFGCENLAFKMLRNSGCIKLLYDARKAAQDRELSLREADRPQKRFRYGFGEGMQSQPYSTSDGVAASTKQFLEDSDSETNLVQEFIQHTATELGIDPMPEIHLHTDPDWSTHNHSFGRYDPDSHTLNVSMPNRHILDVLRTVAHELVHCSQNQQHGHLPDDAGETGSRWENDANARAGIIMRDWANTHPEHFELPALSEGINKSNQLTLRDFVVTISPHALDQAHAKGVDVHMVDDILRNISKVKDNIMSLEPGRALILHNGQGTGLGVRRGQGNNLTLATVFPTNPRFQKGKHPTFQVEANEFIHRPLREDIEDFAIANVRRPNGAIGNQGVNTEQAADVLTHAAGMQVSPDMTMRQLVDALKADPAAQQRLRQFVQQNPVTVYALPDGSYHLQDGHHRTFLLNLLGDETVPAVVKEDVMEAPLADYVPMGDFDKPGPFRGADKKLIPHPVNQLKTAKFFEKTPYDFRLFFSNIPGTGKYSEYGVMDTDTVKIIFGDAGEQIVAGHENAITVVYVGNSGDSKVMLTPWMMAHRLGHAIQAGARGQPSNQQHPWKAGEEHFFGQVNSMLEEYYGKSGQQGGNLKAELTPEYNALFNAMGTQRSSRSGEIRRPYEFLYEIFAQYLGTGAVLFNALPANLGYGRRAWGNPSRYLNIKPEYRDEAARKQAAEVLSYDMELMFNDALSNAEGKILVM